VLKSWATTGVGSLPHASIEDAIQLAFAVDIPYLPELPARGERMLDQVLIEDPEDSHAAFEGFVRRLAIEGRAWGKVQIAGPILVRQVHPRSGATDLLARKTERMIAAVQRTGASALIFFDEPTLGAARDLDPLRDLLLHARSLGAKTGIHCCGPMPWTSALALPADFIGFDLTLGLPPLDAAQAYVEQGGALALGLVPTDGSEPLLARLKALEGLLEGCLCTPACGLGLRTVEVSEAVFRTLATVQASA